MPQFDLPNPPNDAVRTGPPRWAVAALAVVVAAGYLACVHNQWYPTSDSALYVGLGRSLAEGHGYQFNGQPDTYVTPGLPWLYMACLRLSPDRASS